MFFQLVSFDILSDSSSLLDKTFMKEKNNINEIDNLEVLLSQRLMAATILAGTLKGEKIAFKKDDDDFEKDWISKVRGAVKLAQMIDQESLSREEK
ncbi:hypothetical protein BH10CYA1_BH10CYA1_63240 [soil metagenome]